MVVQVSRGNEFPQPPFTFIRKPPFDRNFRLPQFILRSAGNLEPQFGNYGLQTLSTCLGIIFGTVILTGDLNDFCTVMPLGE